MLQALGIVIIFLFNIFVIKLTIFYDHEISREYKIYYHKHDDSPKCHLKPNGIMRHKCQ